MIVQRLSIRAAIGSLQIIPVWRYLAKSRANVFRWHIDVDRKRGVESLTVDIVESDPLRTAEIAASLGEAPLEITITPFQLAVFSNSGAAQKSAVSSPVNRRGPRLTLVRDITQPISLIKRD